MSYKSEVRPLCRQCAKPIAKSTRTVYVHGADSGFFSDSHSSFSRHLRVEQPLLNIADCQKHTNLTVASVSYRPATDKVPRHVSVFTEWDGESWKDAYFCTGTCATKFAYQCAREGLETQAHATAMRERKP